MFQEQIGVDKHACFQVIFLGDFTYIAETRLSSDSNCPKKWKIGYFLANSRMEKGICWLKDRNYIFQLILVSSWSTEWDIISDKINSNLLYYKFT